MSNFSELLDQVLPEVKGCPKSVAVREIRNAAIDLCKHAPIWTEYLTEIETDVGEPDLDISDLLPDYAIAYKILSLSSTRGILEPVVFSRFHEISAANQREEMPAVFCSPTPSNILLAPVPNEVYELKAAVSLCPKVTATEIKDEVLEVWGGAFVNGALHRLMRFSATPWSNGDMAALYLNLFERDKGEAKSTSVIAHASMNKSVRARQFE